MKRARKLSDVNVYDFPRNDYSAMWEYDTVRGAQSWAWNARLYDADSNTLIKEANGAADNEERARAAAQAWAKAQMGGYKRQAPWHAISKADAVQLLDLFDAARLGTEYPRTGLEVLWCCENYRSTPNHDLMLAKWANNVVLERSQMLSAGTVKPSYGLCDRIRGLLASQGYKLAEAESATAAGPTKLATTPGKQSGRMLGLGPLGLLWEALEWCMWTFALAYSSTIRSTRVDDVSNAIDAGAGAGLWRIYDGSRPATGGAATTLLAQLTFTDPNAGAPAAGVLTFSAITQDASADATGTATWGRWVDSTAAFVADHNVGTSGSDLNVNTVAFTVGDTVSISSAVLTGGNP